MRIFYDTEFIDDGTTIDLVSIGMVREDGAELYAVSSQFNVLKLQANPWLVENVWSSLPSYKHPGTMRCHCGPGHLDTSSPDVRSRAQIANLVADFILDTPDPQLWAYYSAYDHVALAQLWGPMINLPRGIPMQSDDIVTEAKRLGLRPNDLPQQPDGLHNALADARHNLVRARFLDEIAAQH
ncbi:3'-5' exoribonuclease [Streptomyces caniscabiei]|uniref:3'-5' exoribonuclease n=1 Tax=Streptomyces caniscabiei TaxID=2746961 RepID=UPI0018732D6C|nr:3'-5' exoribonuclease [Streptomyces caniscabiei]MBE4783944.1 3'-5' exoribonuclease [Streptomyces caniscabiei]MBE4791557.1 3'-5' exoribonuclease [Streptomyces caniscabiei]MDX3009206.1 3'-5' exoribonuclease [Streptomyces caniscabiei]